MRSALQNETLGGAGSLIALLSAPFRARLAGDFSNEAARQG